MPVVVLAFGRMNKVHCQRELQDSKDHVMLLFILPSKNDFSLFRPEPLRLSFGLETLYCTCEGPDVIRAHLICTLWTVLVRPAVEGEVWQL